MNNNNQSLTLDELFRLWASEHRSYVRSSTFRCYVSIYKKHLREAFGDRVSISTNDVEIFARGKVVSAGLSRKTTKDILTLLGMIVKFGEEKGYGWSYVPDRFRFPSSLNADVASRQPLVSTFTCEEQKRITRYVLGNFTCANLGILVCLYTGMRIGEICALRWKDIDIDRRMIRVSRTLGRMGGVGEDFRLKKTQIVESTPKTDYSVREIPLVGVLFGLIQPLYEESELDNYLISNSPRAIEPRRYQAYYSDFLIRAGVRYLKFHCLRHTFATRCIESGCDIKTTSALLGHSSITITLDTYVHPSLETKRKSIVKMSRFVGFPRKSSRLQ